MEGHPRTFGAAGFPLDSYIPPSFLLPGLEFMANVKVFLHEVLQQHQHTLIRIDEVQR